MSEITWEPNGGFSAIGKIKGNRRSVYIHMWGRSWNVSLRDPQGKRVGSKQFDQFEQAKEFGEDWLKGGR
jgi:hypothetical protein